jgi:hypothetical protein
MQSKYFWPIMFSNPHDHVKRYNACQCYAHNNIYMELPLHPSLRLVAFEK